MARKTTKKVEIKDLEHLLVFWTGEGKKFWLNWIGEKIGKYATGPKVKIKGNVHDTMKKGWRWLQDLSKEVWDRTVTRLPDGMDENILCARITGLILTLWTCRIIRAKSYDPRRPAKVRRTMMDRFVDTGRFLIECVADESLDHAYFPSQEWDPPFPDSAKDGTYV